MLKIKVFKNSLNGVGYYLVSCSLTEMEQLLHEKAFESEGQLQSLNDELNKVRQQLADRERQIMASPSQGNPQRLTSL